MTVSVKKIVKGLVPVLVLAASVVGAKALIASRPQPQKKPRAESAVLVETRTVERTTQPVRVEANGSVTSAYEVELAAEVGGRVVWKNPLLTTGGLVKKGDMLLRIDAQDYKLALASQQASLERAQADLDMEHGRRTVAEREWQMFGAKDGASSSLALREPQLKSARLGVATAQSSLSKAELNLKRATVRAPFNAVVRQNFTETGKLVTPGQRLADLVQTDTFVVVVSLPVADLAWLKVPGTNMPPLTDEATDAAWASENPLAAFAKLGTMAKIRQDVGHGVIERDGIVTRLLSDLDPVGRMAQLLVSISDPMKLAEGAKGEGVAGLPLLLGAYVSVELLGDSVADVVELPRVALRDGNRVYIMDDDDKLAIREVSIMRRRAKAVLVSSGLTGGERVVTSAMPAAIEGTELRLAGAPAPAGARAQAETP